MSNEKHPRLVLTDKTEEARAMVRKRVSKLAKEYGVTIHDMFDAGANFIDGTSVRGVNFVMSGDRFSELSKRIGHEYNNHKYILNRD